jgi:hypothetical protein
MVEWAINELVSHNVLSGPALSLWLHLKGLAWARGECDPTDEYLAQLMGGVTTEMVRLARRELRERCLLLEYRKAAAPGVRWLIPLPVRAGLQGRSMSRWRWPRRGCARWWLGWRRRARLPA